jgi:hypothetical protein
MSVFLRWGVFGILAVAALLYAYNASKRLAERQGVAPPVTATAEEAGTEPQATGEPVPSPQEEEMPAHCETELLVAQRALDARRGGQSLERLLRSQEIAFEEGERRSRLEKVATHWFEREGEAPGAAALRIYVGSDCRHFSPAP